MPDADGLAWAEGLLLMALSDPPSAEQRADAALAAGGDDWHRAVAHQVRGLVRRERGDTGAALVELETALRHAGASGDGDRSADVRATLGVTLAYAGRSADSMGQFDAALDEARTPTVRARVLMRRGFVHWGLLGQAAAALADFEAALVGARAGGDRAWEARTLNNISWIRQSLGDTEAAEAAVLAAQLIFLDEGMLADAAAALHNRAGIAYQRGDLPAALSLYDEADRDYARLGLDAYELAQDRALVLLAAGLPAEAVAVCAERQARGGLAPTQEADLRLMRALALLSAGHPDSALDEATTARRLFDEQAREWFGLRAEYVEIRARLESGTSGPEAAAASLAVAGRLESERAEEAAQAWLLAARLAPDRETGPLVHAATFRSHHLPLTRATGWLAEGWLREAQGDGRGVLRACRSGLDELDRHRATLGSSELRALASRHGEDLAALALRTTVTGTPRRLLAWSERWRATSLSQPPVRLGSAQVAGPVALLRDNARRLREAREEGGDVSALEVERRRLEASLRSRLHQSAGAGDPVSAPLDVPALVSAAGGGSFVELIEVAGTLHAVVVSRGAVRRVEVGSVEAAEQAATAAAFALRQAARGRPARLAQVGERLERALLGRAAGRLTGPVVVSPTPPLHGVPWGVLPSLAGVPHSIVPSAALWLRALDRPAASDARVFVSGPGLTTGGAEIEVVAPGHPDAVVLRDGAATVESSMAALDGAGLAHLAAHGHFRADSPLFSSLDLADGPLAVHDFERLERAPHRVVLSACDSGVLAPVGAGELLGLVSSLLAIGTVGVVASVAVVNDEATVDVMVDVHAALDSGADLAGALLAARTSAADDPTRAATAAAFLALGV